MKNASFSNKQLLPTNLAKARALELPSRAAMLNRTSSALEFWEQHNRLLADAWREWETTENIKLNNVNDVLMDPKLRSAVEQSWDDPSNESKVKDMWEEVSPGVFQCQFFDPEHLATLRQYLENCASAEIPMRPPYGIALNRFGAMLDERSEGFLAAPSFQSFYRNLHDRYMRPIARLLFPEIIGFDTQTFGFSIQYQPDMDTSLRLHSDASAATLNVNLNLPDETYLGSEVDFYDPISGKANRLTFKPGVAMLHRGSVAHAAQPITGGKRTNFVLWLYGDRMQLPSRSETGQLITPNERWSKPSANKDKFAPF